MIDPSAFAPYAYRVFAEADPSHPWLDLVDSSYDLLARLGAAPVPGVLPGALVFDPATGAPLPAIGHATGDADGTYNAYWRLALDWLWFKDPRAQAALQALDAPLRQLEDTGRLEQGRASDAMADHAAIVPALLVAGPPDLGHQIFAEQILRRYTDRAGVSSWGDDSYDEDDQTMAWLACAIVDGGLANLWAGDTVIDWTGMDEVGRR